MIRGVDCAYPQTTYPTWAKVVAGYAGGHTAHQWTFAEVQSVLNGDRMWFAIWTARNRKGEPPLAAFDGAQDAEGMAARLPAYPNYRFDKNLPVFYDIEPGIYDLDPVGAQAAIVAWKAGMQHAGYPKAYVYTVKRQGGDWIADWTNVVPASIPAGKVGVQYGGDATFDYDVFIDELLTGDPVTAPADIADAIWAHPTTPVETGGLSIAAGTRLADLDRHLTDVSSKLDTLIGLQQQLVTLLTPKPTP